MTTALAIASVIIGALFLGSLLCFLAICGYEWWRYQRQERAVLTPIIDGIEANRLHREGMERYARVLTSAEVERHIVIPIDAESDEQAWAAITSYGRAA